MNTLLNALTEACRKHKFTAKKLVVDNLQGGHQLLEGMARSGEAWLNVTPVTAARLAEEITAQDLADDGYTVINDGQILFLIGQTLEEMRSTGDLKYYAELEGLEGPEGILKEALMELRMAGLKSQDIKPDQFVDRQKGLEIKAMLSGYEKSLENGKMADQACIYMKAIDILQNSKYSEAILYLLPGQLEFDYLTFTFLEKITAGNCLVLPAEPIRGLTRTKGFYFKTEEKTEALSPLAWIYDLAGYGTVNGDKDLEIFKAYGPACEVKEFFRRLIREEFSADQALICYTNGETYLPLIHSIAESYGVPVTYADGLPVLYSKPGKLLAGLLEWVDDNYSAIHLYRLFSSGCVNVEHELNLTRLLREAAVGWGRERYTGCLDHLFIDFNDRLEKARQDQKPANVSVYLEAQLERTAELKKIISELLNRIPEPDPANTLPFAQFCDGLAGAIDKYAPTVNEMDRSARESIVEMLRVAGCSCKKEIDQRLAVKRLKARLGAMRFYANAAKAGHLHVASIGQAEWAGRLCSFVLGLAEGFFPGSGLQDPVLLDTERQKVSDRLGLASLNPERNLYRLNRFIASRRGRVVLSYPCFDPIEGRISFPSSILLQAYRLLSDEPGADYSAMITNLGRPAAYFPGNEDEALSTDEWWLTLVMGKKKSGKLGSVKECFNGIKVGLAAEEMRRSDIFTEYDGKVSVDPNEVDPRINGAKIISSSAIEKLAGCPFAYYMRYFLDLKPPDEEAFDRWTWLNAMEKGLLLHRIYAEYMEEAYLKRKLQNTDRALLEQIAAREIEITRTLFPPPSDIVFNSEKNELIQSLQVFLKIEDTLLNEGRFHAHPETPFGLGDEEVQGAGGWGLADPPEIELSKNKKIKLRGRIDRIDKLNQQGEYRVWDYKTGGTYAYKENGFIKQGRQIQHIIYSMAAEEVLKTTDPKAQVSKAGYLFSTEKGEGERYLRDQNRRDEALKALNHMFDLLAAGTFCVAEKGEPPCIFCDYRSVCRQPQALEDLQLKKTNSANSELEPWKELQQYE